MVLFNHSDGTIKYGRTKPVETQSIDASWIFRAHCSDDRNGQQLLSQTIVGINSLIQKGQFTVLNQVIDNCPMSAGKHILLAFARASFPVRTRLTSWQSFIRKLEKEFETRGLNASTLLSGLTS